MKTAPVVPARIVRDNEGIPVSEPYGDRYHARDGALAQARHVFIAGNGLPTRWQGRERFTILETGFGLGHNFLATWQAWRRDPQRCEQLVFLSLDKHPPRRETLAEFHSALHEDPVASADTAERASGIAALSRELIGAWPPLSHNLHQLHFDGGRVRLMLAFGDALPWLRELVARADVFYLDGFAPAHNPAIWSHDVFAALARLAARDASAATWCLAREVHDGLAAAGFVVSRAPGLGSRREMTVAQFAPRFMPQHAVARRLATRAPQPVVVLGAGLAGAACAAAFARHGVPCTVLDRQSAPACETSGNPAGLFHGIVTPDDGLHARFNRAASLFAARCIAQQLRSGLGADETQGTAQGTAQGIAQGIAQDQVQGAVKGALRVETHSSCAEMQALIDRLGLPAEFVRALDARDAPAISGLPLRDPAWFYPTGGWVDPAALCAAWLRAPSIEFRGGCAVARIERSAGRWRLFDADDHLLAEAATLVLANAQDSLRLLGQPPWPLQSLRGQATQVAPGVITGMRLPVAGNGYLIPLPDGTVLCGASSHESDAETQARDADRAQNLQRAAQLAGLDVIAPAAVLNERVGWRLAATDRLPVVGAVPAFEAALDASVDPTREPPAGRGVERAGASKAAARRDQPRFIPREPGLFVCTALGSRGIAWSPLAGELVAAWATGAPLPLEASLVDAVDPARFIARAARSAAS